MLVPAPFSPPVYASLAPGVDGGGAARQTPPRPTTQNRTGAALLGLPAAADDPSRRGKFHSPSHRRSVNGRAFHRARHVLGERQHAHECVTGSSLAIKIQQHQCVWEQIPGPSIELSVTARGNTLSPGPEAAFQPPLISPSCSGVPPISRPSSCCSRGSFTEPATIPDETRPTPRLPRADSLFESTDSQTSGRVMALGLFIDSNGEKTEGHVSWADRQQPVHLLSAKAAAPQGGASPDRILLGPSRMQCDPVRQRRPLSEKTRLRRPEPAAYGEGAEPPGYHGHAKAAEPQLAVTAKQLCGAEIDMREIEKGRGVYGFVGKDNCYGALSGNNREGHNGEERRPLSPDCRDSGIAEQTLPLSSKLTRRVLREKREAASSPFKERPEPSALACSYSTVSPACVYCPSHPGSFRKQGAVRAGTDSCWRRGGSTHSGTAVRGGEEKEEGGGRNATGGGRDREGGACDPGKQPGNLSGRTPDLAVERGLDSSGDSLKSSSVLSCIPDERSAGRKEGQPTGEDGAADRRMDCGPQQEIESDEQITRDCQRGKITSVQQVSRELTSSASFLDVADERCGRAEERSSSCWVGETRRAELSCDEPFYLNISQAPTRQVSGRAPASLSGKSAVPESNDADHRKQRFGSLAVLKELHSEADATRSLNKEPHTGQVSPVTLRVVAAVWQGGTKAEQEAAGEHGEQRTGREVKRERVQEWGGVEQNDHERRYGRHGPQAWKETFRSRSPPVTSCRWPDTAFGGARKARQAAGGHQRNGSPSSCTRLPWASSRPCLMNASCQQPQGLSRSDHQQLSCRRGGDAVEQTPSAHREKENEKNERARARVGSAVADGGPRKCVGPVRSPPDKIPRSRLASLCSRDGGGGVHQEAFCSFFPLQRDVKKRELSFLCNEGRQSLKPCGVGLKDTTKPPRKAPERIRGAEKDVSSLQQEDKELPVEKRACPKRSCPANVTSFSSSPKKETRTPAASLDIAEPHSRRSQAGGHGGHSPEGVWKLQREPQESRATKHTGTTDTRRASLVGLLQPPMEIVRHGPGDPLYAPSRSCRHPLLAPSASGSHCPSSLSLTSACSPRPARSTAPAGATVRAAAAVHPYVGPGQGGALTSSRPQLTKDLKLPGTYSEERRNTDRCRHTGSVGKGGARNVSSPRDGSPAAPRLLSGLSPGSSPQRASHEDSTAPIWRPFEQSMSSCGHLGSPRTSNTGCPRSVAYGCRPMSKRCFCRPHSSRPFFPDGCGSPSSSHGSGCSEALPSSRFSSAPRSSPAFSSSPLSCTPSPESKPCAVAGVRADVALREAWVKDETNAAENEVRRTERLSVPETIREATASPAVRPWEKVPPQVADDKSPEGLPVAVDPCQHARGTSTPESRQESVSLSLKQKKRKHDRAPADEHSETACPDSLQKTQSGEAMLVLGAGGSGVWPLSASHTKSRIEKPGERSCPASYFSGLSSSDAVWMRRNGEGVLCRRAPSERGARSAPFSQSTPKTGCVGDSLHAPRSNRIPRPFLAGTAAADEDRLGCFSPDAVCAPTTVVAKKSNGVPLEDIHANVEHAAAGENRQTAAANLHMDDKKKSQGGYSPPSPIRSSGIPALTHGHGLVVAAGECSLPSCGPEPSDSRRPTTRTREEQRQRGFADRNCLGHYAALENTWGKATDLLRRPSPATNGRQAKLDSEVPNRGHETLQFRPRSAGVSPRHSIDLAEEETASLQASVGVSSRPPGLVQSQPRQAEEGNKQEARFPTEGSSLRAVQLSTQGRAPRHEEPPRFLKCSLRRSDWHWEAREGPTESLQGTPAATRPHREEHSSWEKGRAATGTFERTAASEHAKGTISEERHACLSSAEKRSSSKECPTFVSDFFSHEESETATRTALGKRVSGGKERGGLVRGALECRDVDDEGFKRTKDGKQTEDGGTCGEREYEASTGRACFGGEEATKERGEGSAGTGRAYCCFPASADQADRDLELQGDCWCPRKRGEGQTENCEGRIKDCWQERSSGVAGLRQERGQAPRVGCDSPRARQTDKEVRGDDRNSESSRLGIPGGASENVVERLSISRPEEEGERQGVARAKGSIPVNCNEGDDREEDAGSLPGVPYRKAESDKRDNKKAGRTMVLSCGQEGSQEDREREKASSRTERMLSHSARGNREEARTPPLSDGHIRHDCEPAASPPSGYERTPAVERAGTYEKSTGAGADKVSLGGRQCRCWKEKLQPLLRRGESCCHKEKLGRRSGAKSVWQASARRQEPVYPPRGTESEAKGWSKETDVHADGSDRAAPAPKEEAPGSEQKQGGGEVEEGARANESGDVMLAEEPRLCKEGEEMDRQETRREVVTQRSRGGELAAERCSGEKKETEREAEKGKEARHHRDGMGIHREDQGDSGRGRKGESSGDGRVRVVRTTEDSGYSQGLAAATQEEGEGDRESAGEQASKNTVAQGHSQQRETNKGVTEHVPSAGGELQEEKKDCGQNEVENADTESEAQQRRDELEGVGRKGEGEVEKEAESEQTAAREGAQLEGDCTQEEKSPENAGDGGSGSTDPPDSTAVDGGERLYMRAPRLPGAGRALGRGGLTGTSENPQSPSMYLCEILRGDRHADHRQGAASTEYAHPTKVVSLSEEEDRDFRAAPNTLGEGDDPREELQKTLFELESYCVMLDGEAHGARSSPSRASLNRPLPRPASSSCLLPAGFPCQSISASLPAESCLPPAAKEGAGRKAHEDQAAAQGSNLREPEAEKTAKNRTTEAEPAAESTKDACSRPEAWFSTLGRGPGYARLRPAVRGFSSRPPVCLSSTFARRGPVSSLYRAESSYLPRHPKMTLLPPLPRSTSSASARDSVPQTLPRPHSSTPSPFLHPPTSASPVPSPSSFSSPASPPLSRGRHSVPQGRLTLPEASFLLPVPVRARQPPFSGQPTCAQDPCSGSRLPQVVAPDHSARPWHAARPRHAARPLLSMQLAAASQTPVSPSLPSPPVWPCSASPSSGSQSWSSLRQASGQGRPSVGGGRKPLELAVEPMPKEVAPRESEQRQRETPAAKRGVEKVKVWRTAKQSVELKMEERECRTSSCVSPVGEENGRPLLLVRSYSYPLLRTGTEPSEVFPNAGFSLRSTCPSSSCSTDDSRFSFTAPYSSHCLRPDSCASGRSALSTAPNPLSCLASKLLATSGSASRVHVDRLSPRREEQADVTEESSDAGQTPRHMETVSSVARETGAHVARQTTCPHMSQAGKAAGYPPDRGTAEKRTRSSGSLEGNGGSEEAQRGSTGREGEGVGATDGDTGATQETGAREKAGPPGGLPHAGEEKDTRAERHQQSTPRKHETQDEERRDRISTAQPSTGNDISQREALSVVEATEGWKKWHFGRTFSGQLEGGNENEELPLDSRRQGFLGSKHRETSGFPSGTLADCALSRNDNPRDTNLKRASALSLSPHVRPPLSDERAPVRPARSIRSNGGGNPRTQSEPDTEWRLQEGRSEKTTWLGHSPWRVPRCSVEASKEPVPSGETASTKGRVDDTLAQAANEGQGAGEYYHEDAVPDRGEGIEGTGESEQELVEGAAECISGKAEKRATKERHVHEEHRKLHSPCFEEAATGVRRAEETPAARHRYQAQHLLADVELSGGDGVNRAVSFLGETAAAPGQQEEEKAVDVETLIGELENILERNDLQPLGDDLAEGLLQCHTESERNETQKDPLQCGCACIERPLEGAAAPVDETSDPQNYTAEDEGPRFRGWTPLGTSALRSQLLSASKTLEAPPNAESAASPSVPELPSSSCSVSLPLAPDGRQPTCAAGLAPRRGGNASSFGSGSLSCGSFSVSIPCASSCSSPADHSFQQLGVGSSSCSPGCSPANPPSSATCGLDPTLLDRSLSSAPFPGVPVACPLTVLALQTSDSASPVSPRPPCLLASACSFHSVCYSSPAARGPSTCAHSQVAHSVPPSLQDLNTLVPVFPSLALFTPSAPSYAAPLVAPHSLPSLESTPGSAPEASSPLLLRETLLTTLCHAGGGSEFRAEKHGAEGFLDADEIPVSKTSSMSSLCSLPSPSRQPPEEPVRLLGEGQQKAPFSAVRYPAVSSAVSASDRSVCSLQSLQLPGTSLFAFADSQFFWSLHGLPVVYPSCRSLALLSPSCPSVPSSTCLPGLPSLPSQHAHGGRPSPPADEALRDSAVPGRRDSRPPSSSPSKSTANNDVGFRLEEREVSASKESVEGPDESAKARKERALGADRSPPLSRLAPSPYRLWAPSDGLQSLFGFSSSPASPFSSPEGDVASRGGPQASNLCRRPNTALLSAAVGSQTHEVVLKTQDKYAGLKRQKKELGTLTGEKAEQKREETGNEERWKTRKNLQRETPSSTENCETGAKLMTEEKVNQKKNEGSDTGAGRAATQKEERTEFKKATEKPEQRSESRDNVFDRLFNRRPRSYAAAVREQRRLEIRRREAERRAQEELAECTFQPNIRQSRRPQVGRDRKTDRRRLRSGARLSHRAARTWTMPCESVGPPKEDRSAQKGEGGLSRAQNGSGKEVEKEQMGHTELDRAADGVAHTKTTLGSGGPERHDHPSAQVEQIAWPEDGNREDGAVVSQSPRIPGERNMADSSVNTVPAVTASRAVGTSCDRASEGLHPRSRGFVASSASKDIRRKNQGQGRDAREERSSSVQWPSKRIGLAELSQRSSRQETEGSLDTPRDLEAAALGWEGRSRSARLRSPCSYAVERVQHDVPHRASICLSEPWSAPLHSGRKRRAARTAREKDVQRGGGLSDPEGERARRRLLGECRPSFPSREVRRETTKDRCGRADSRLSGGPCGLSRGHCSRLWFPSPPSASDSGRHELHRRSTGRIPSKAGKGGGRGLRLSLRSGRRPARILPLSEFLAEPRGRRLRPVLFAAKRMEKKRRARREEARKARSLAELQLGGPSPIRTERSSREEATAGSEHALCKKSPLRVQAAHQGTERPHSSKQGKDQEVVRTTSRVTRLHRCLSLWERGKLRVRKKKNTTVDFSLWESCRL